MNRKIRTAIITGGHHYEVPAFQIMWQELQNISAFPQHIEDFSTSPAEIRRSYDVLIFFNFNQRIPTDENNVSGEGARIFRHEVWLDGKIREMLNELEGTSQGIMVWHHSILAWPKWNLWSKICGMLDRSFEDVNCDKIRTHIIDDNHPITRGISPWQMNDEVYLMGKPDATCTPILGTIHPKSMPIIAWTHTLARSRVFVYQSGHNHTAFGNPSFRKVMGNAVSWLAGINF